MKSIVQDWACRLGLRHQGVLMAAIRGCDGLEKNHVSKRIARALRADVLNSHVGDPRKSRSFIQVFDEETFSAMTEELTSELDVYPLHYIMHLAHAAEILGYKHPDLNTHSRWRILYFRICKRLHVNPETEEQLDARLNADEETFASDGNNVNELAFGSVT